MTEKIARGPSFVFAKEYIVKSAGENGWQDLLKRLPAEDAEIWRGNLLISEDYPFPAFKAMTKAWSEQTGRSSNEATSVLYEHIADRSLNSVYRFFFKFANPALVLKNYPKLWARFFTVGTVTVTVPTKGQAVVSFTLPEIFQDWLEPACYGYSKKAVEMAGGSGFGMRPSSAAKISNGMLEVSYELVWSE